MPSIPAIFVDTLGSFFIGCIVSSILFGVNCLHLIIYCKLQYKRDSVLFKCLIWFLWTLDVAHVILLLSSLYDNCILTVSDLLGAAKVHWQEPAAFILIAISTTAMRCCYAWRIYIFTKNPFVPIIIAITSGILFGATIAFSVKSLSIRLWINLDEASIEIYLMYGAAVFADLLITVTQSYMLLKSRTGFIRTNSVINKIMLYGINNGLAALIFHTSSLATYAAFPQSLICAGIYICSSKWYLTAFFAYLNTRGSLTEKLEARPMHLPISVVSVGPPSEPNHKEEGLDSDKVADIRWIE